MASQSTSKKRLALAIIDFLNSSLTDGTVSADDSESIEIASNCIAEAFKVDPTDTAAVSDALGGQNLLSIYGVYEKLKGKSGAAASGASSSSSKPAAAATDAETKEKAEKLKGQGNSAMASKNYDSAIDFYTQALELVPLNPIYLSNRAAAYSGKQKHDLAKADAEMAVAADPKFAKAWSRLGLAKFALGDAKGSMEAYQKGIDAEGNGGSDAMKKGFETAKRRFQEEGGSAEGDVSESTRGAGGAGGAGGMPDLSSLASMLGGGGGGAGGGPDFSQLMNNPMMRQMAQNVMSNPDMMNNILNNPRLREMADSFGRGGGGAGGGGMPDLSSLMQDPSIAEMARNFMGGAGGPGAGAGAGAGRGGSA